MKAEGNVGVSPEKAETLLVSVGVERSPLVRAIRQAQRDRALVHHIILVPLIEEGVLD